MTEQDIPAAWSVLRAAETVVADAELEVQRAANVRHRAPPGTTAPNPSY